MRPYKREFQYQEIVKSAELTGISILSSQVVSLPFQSVIQEIANFCAAMDTLIDQDGVYQTIGLNIYIYILFTFMKQFCEKLYLFQIQISLHEVGYLLSRHTRNDQCNGNFS